ncbi:MAG: hypothetical protein ACKOA9_07430 [Actinomycetota bacterium]
MLRESVAGGGRRWCDRRSWVAVCVVGFGVVVLGSTGLAASEPVSTLSRPDTPVVLTGANLPALVETDPSRIVAFKHTTVSGVNSWSQIPVQIDQRKVVPFGSQPSKNSSAGVVGTVYGSGSGGPTALQYADAGTWVGADTNPAFDADDELVFMARDAGGVAPASAASLPAGVVAGSGVAVRVGDPRATTESGTVYLFRSNGSLSPSAGQDYVDYRFQLTSGAYLTTYRRSSGPNPETSRVVTPTYEIGFTDRWYETSWKVRTGGATGVDFLDGNKNQFGLSSCLRSNATFATAEGAFVANIDGSVRGIRSYVGANSGPLTQRTHLMYRDREEIVTDLRVHSIAAIMDFLDYSAAASGMTYRSSVVPGGVTVNGVQDTVGSARPGWEAVNGTPGRVYTATRIIASQAGLVAGATGYYEDRITPAQRECWGDRSYYGASGLWVTTGIANTDPRATPFETFRASRVVQFLGPAGDPSVITSEAADWAADVDAPLTTAVSPYQPSP